MCIIITKPTEDLPGINGNIASSNDRTSIVFTLKNQVGGLARALQVFQELGINVLHVEFHQTGGKHELVRESNKYQKSN